MKLNLFALLFIAITSSFNIQATPIDNDKVKRTLETLSKSNQLIGTHAIALVDENGLASFVHYSSSEKEFNKTTPFLIASHTKAMTSTLLSILHANKEIDINKPLNTYHSTILTNPNLQLDDLNLQKLLTHSGGFTSVEHTFKSSFLGAENSQDLTNALNRKTLIAPDNRFRYSNTGPIVAAMYTESQLESSWHELMKNRLFNPLGMSSTTTTIENIDNILPSITTSKNGEAFTTGHHKYNETMHASGGIVSNIQDLAMWVKANINQEYKVFSTNNIFIPLHTKQVEQNKEYFTYKRHGYTLGWDIADYNDEQLLTRFGNYAGYSVHISFMPKHKIGVIAMTNQDIAFALPHVIANYTYNLALNKSNTIQQLNNESIRLNSSIAHEISKAPTKQHIINARNFPKHLLGKYQNNNKWPSHDVYIENDEIKVKWGVLKGTLLKVDDNYSVHFGALNRKVEWSINENSISMKNGSLVYNKI